MATNNAINCKTAGIVTYDGAGTFGADTTTNHNVLIGAASNGITNVAPSATSGVPLISQGASADPAFGTAVVGGGGTGNTTFNAYSVITAGTTATGAFQNVSGLGTSGQVLTSAGASALPTWSTAPSGVFAPNSVVNIFEDFLGFVNVSGVFFCAHLTWGQSPTQKFVALAASSSDNAHPGIISNAASSVGCGILLGFGNSGNSGISVGGGAITINWVFKIVTLSNSTNRYTLRIGLGDTSQAAQANGVYVEYTDNVNSGDWNFITASGSTRTTSNSSTTVTTGWHNLQISVNAAGSSVSYTMDGSSLGTAISTNIPTTAIVPIFDFVTSVGTVATGSLFVDLMYLTQILTSAR